MFPSVKKLVFGVLLLSLFSGVVVGEDLQQEEVHSGVVIDTWVAWDRMYIMDDDDGPSGLSYTFVPGIAVDIGDEVKFLWIDKPIGHGEVNLNDRSKYEQLISAMEPKLSEVVQVGDEVSFVVDGVKYHTIPLGMRRKYIPERNKWVYVVGDVEYDDQPPPEKRTTYRVSLERIPGKEFRGVELFFHREPYYLNRI